MRFSKMNGTLAEQPGRLYRGHFQPLSDYPPQPPSCREPLLGPHSVLEKYFFKFVRLNICFLKIHGLLDIWRWLVVICFTFL
jgi:hypothetical protein